MKKHRNALSTPIIVIAVLVIALLGVTGYFALSGKDEAPASDDPVVFAAVDSSAYKKDTNPVATIKMQGVETPIVVELYPDAAPNTVANFISLANSGFYNGLTFHRVIPTFMIQGGCPLGNGTGDPGYSIKGEFAQNNVVNNLAHTRGVISMARSSAPDSAGSQFFIMHADAPHLDGGYAAFGEVISGMETVDLIASTQTDYTDKPLVDQVIESITVDTKGIEYKVNKIGG
ncbi:MAG: peptidylprolyl isomerase [Clostridiales bacterium]|nr:peptidylprolyl isomerase [Clostridiales bacterium]